MNFTLSDTEKVNVLQYNVLLKTSMPGDPWVKHKNCIIIASNIIQCPGERENNAQNFKVTANYTQGDTNKTVLFYQEEFWYYTCFENHGVKKLTVSNVTWNKFTVQWEHYNNDENFIMSDRIVIVNWATGKENNVKGDEAKRAYTYNQAIDSTEYNVCVTTVFFGSLTDDSSATTLNLEKITPEKCVNVTTSAAPTTSTTDWKAPVLAVGIGALCLVLLCLVFVVYNKKCKQGGDHDYDMNKDETLMGDHNDGEEMQENTNTAMFKTQEQQNQGKEEGEESGGLNTEGEEA